MRNGILLEFQEESEGGYTITVPALPGCVSYGDSFEQALEMTKDAMVGWLAVAEEEGIRPNLCVPEVRAALLSF
ncbi:MAG: type II toxin-antitoxin system HicB family antitoxin [Chloroflexi bacterium]|nr:type II toxin-antitoxin system HicB family antitoxin [Chloroflexota bacterium]